MYHGLILEDLLDFINLGRAYRDIFPAGDATPSTVWVDTANRMRVWLRSMCHPDGEIALMNDAAFGIAPSPTELEV